MRSVRCSRGAGPAPAAFAHQFERWVSEDGDAGKERAVRITGIPLKRRWLFTRNAHAIGEVATAALAVSDEIWASQTTSG